ncbi:hypothetical protein [Candidatus Uabimicrobium amorphum]|uniref:Uncharacterized protein n=1 Tax=Uabimicrobium amorphum TaxID=2596890 RepID=A0A5S9F604_UABAM|nr:hypothetical protein [Candidatus Uabimicrobium amorphum]BBM85812.1 hypothetical protein UABAM_04190 [Candidatus Uabimicrobium amorphum]
MSQIIIPHEHCLHSFFCEVALRKRVVCFAGLPGVGKTLFLQQMVLFAQQAGRKVHLLQWDVARNAFETPQNMKLYPEVAGVTHPMIRKATGLWSRVAVREWWERYTAPHMLLVEMPLVGNRFIELVQHLEDQSENILQNEECLFILPVPTKKVRETIEDIRAKTTANPRHEREAHDANPEVLRSLWRELFYLALHLKIIDEMPPYDTAYDPNIYQKTFEYLLRHRRVKTIEIDTIFPQECSAYDVTGIESEPMASSQVVRDIVSTIQKNYTEEQLHFHVEKWYEV